MSVVLDLQLSGEVLAPAVERALLLLEEEAAGLRELVDLLTEQVRHLKGHAAQLEAENQVLRERVRELESRHGMNSMNSSLPPSSDPPGTVRPKKKPKSKRKRGGQRGHPGHHRSLLPPDRVDRVVEHRPETCAHCGSSLADASEAGRPHLHQVIELPPIRAEVTEHRSLSVRCPCCGRKSRAELPREVARTSFGPRLSAFAVLLVSRFRISRRGLVELFSDLLDVPAPALGTTARLCQEASAALRTPWREAVRGVRRSRKAHADETPWKLRGMLRWLWVAVSERATLFRIGRSRSARDRERLLGRSHPGTLITDRWRAYDAHPVERRQLCWAHLQRNLQAIADRGGAAAEIGRAGVAEVERLFAAYRRWREGEIPRKAMEKEIALIRARFGRLIRRGTESEDKKARALSRDLHRLWPALWTFLYEETVPPDNNAAERALRHAVLWRRTSFGSQSGKGMRFTERVLTVVATCRIHQHNVLDYLTRAIFAHRSGQPIPRLIPIG